MKHRTFYFFRIFALFFGLGIFDLCAANMEFTCDVENGFNFTSDTQQTIGYITSLTVGTTTLRADLNVKDPTKNGAATTAVAVLSQVSWNSGMADPFKLTGQISTSNKQTLALLLSKPVTNTQVQIGFKVAQYDPLAKKWFTGLAPAADAILKGSIVKSTSPPLALTVGSEPGSVKSPTNFQMSLQIVPQTIAQSIQFATGDGKTVIKKWGVATP